MSLVWIAHRGDCQSVIENTLASISSAIENGITHIEIDIQLTKDAVPVLFHDRNLKRMCKQNNAIAEIDVNTLQQLTLQPDDNVHLKYKTDKISLLSEVVTLIEKHPQVTLFVEIKRVNFLHFSYQKVYNTIIKALKSIIFQIVLISFSYRFLRHCQRHSNQNIAYVLPNWQQLTPKLLARLHPNYIFCDIKLIPREYIFNHSKFNWVLYEISDIHQAKIYINKGVRYLESFNAKNLQQQISP